jgi:lipoprotein-anchoring transpeptidase ErfK/SrfK
MKKKILLISVMLVVAVQVCGQPRAERIVISKEALMLTVYGASGAKIAEYPVAVGLNYGDKQREGDKKTPEGTFEVQQIQNASYWTHDFGDGKGEIKGAYGSHFIRLLTPGHKGIGIHGTHDPASIGSRATEGCIRLKNEDLSEFVKMVRVGLPVIITGDDETMSQKTLTDTDRRRRSEGL